MEPAAGGVSALSELEALRVQFGDGCAARKLALVERLRGRWLGNTSQVLRYHELLSFLHAYPDSRALHREVERQLSRFARRADLRRHRTALAGSGIAGTRTRYRFFAPTAFWLARRWGAHLHVDWGRFANRERLLLYLPLFALASERAALEEYAGDGRTWVRRLKGDDETDAAYLVRSFVTLPIGDGLREALWDALDPALLLEPGPTTPTRTCARHRRSRVCFRQGLRRGRPDLPADISRPPLAVRTLARAEGRALIDLARAAMVARKRDLDAFSSGSPDAVALADCEDGLQFALIGVRPNARWLLEAQWGFLILQSGVPIGYGTFAALYQSCSVAYNVFDSFRGAEAAWVFGRLLAVARSVLGAETFRISSYQIGDDNQEALRSGAFWFYRKLGFAPRERAALQSLEREEQWLCAQPGRRSSAGTLRRLSRSDLFLTCGPARNDVLGSLPLAATALGVQRLIASRYGGDRARAAAEATEAAARLLRISVLRARPMAERLAFRSWAPLILALPGVVTWSAADRRALFEVACAKGGRNERDYVARFDAHARLRAAVRRLAEDAT